MMVQRQVNCAASNSSKQRKKAAQGSNARKQRKEATQGSYARKLRKKATQESNARKQRKEASELRACFQFFLCFEPRQSLQRSHTFSVQDLLLKFCAQSCAIASFWVIAFWPVVAVPS